MPPPEATGRHQAAVLWEAAGTDDDYGRPQVTSPVQINVRWEKERRESIDAKGNTIAIDSTVTVDQVIPIGSVMWLGELKDVADPPVDLEEVVGRGDIPDVKGRETRMVVTLRKLSDELPTIV